MTFVRSFRLTPDDILSADTFHAESVEVWDGDDVEYALGKAEWEKALNIPSENEQND